MGATRWLNTGLALSSVGHGEHVSWGLGEHGQKATKPRPGAVGLNIENIPADDLCWEHHGLAVSAVAKLARHGFRPTMNFPGKGPIETKYGLAEAQREHVCTSKEIKTALGYPGAMWNNERPGGWKIAGERIVDGQATFRAVATVACRDSACYFRKKKKGNKQAV